MESRVAWSPHARNGYLAIWILGYLLMSCAPQLQGDVGGGLIWIFLGGALLVPWLLGAVVGGLIVLITNPRPGPHR